MIDGIQTQQLHSDGPHYRCLPSAGCWSSSTARAFHPQDSAERFQSCSEHLIPFPKLLGAIRSTEHANAVPLVRIGVHDRREKRQFTSSVRLGTPRSVVPDGKVAEKPSAPGCDNPLSGFRDAVRRSGVYRPSRKWKMRRAHGWQYLPRQPVPSSCEIIRQNYPNSSPWSGPVDVAKDLSARPNWFRTLTNKFESGTVLGPKA